MSKGMSLGLLVVGIIIIVLGALEHYSLKIAVMPHFSTIVAIVGLVVAAVGAWGFMRGRQGA